MTDREARTSRNQQNNLEAFQHQKGHVAAMVAQ
jgi:hypothetical protein